jgi:Zn finger protein HypA/HybF involved in hydrogenase expression
MARRAEEHCANVPIPLRAMRDNVRANRTIFEHEVAEPKCPKCGSKKVSVVPGQIYVMTSKKS